MFFRMIWKAYLGKYHSPSQADIYYFDNLYKAFGNYSSSEKGFLIGDFNMETSEPRIDSFLYKHELYNHVKEKTCFKSVDNPSCIDLILTNNDMAFHNTTIVFISLLDFYKLVLTVLKTSIIKGKPQKITCGGYKKFDSVRFNDEPEYVLAKEKITSCTKYYGMFLRILNKNAPIKSKLLRANYASYISKPLRRAIMKRLCLENLYFKKRTSLRNYKKKKKKSYCSRLYKKERKNYFNRLNTST